MEDSSKKPGLAILIGHALAEKGKAKHDPMAESPDADTDDDGLDEHIHTIAEEMLAAIESKDAGQLASLLQEVFEALDK
jgi:restriction endonuclease Mrr